MLFNLNNLFRRSMAMFLPKPGLKPVAEAPVVETPIAETPVIQETVDVLTAPSDPPKPSLNGKLRIIVAAHCDGLAYCRDIPAWKSYALTQASEFYRRGIPFCLEMTKEEVKLIADPKWFSEMSLLGCTFAARESHSMSTAQEAYDALLSFGAVPTNHLGSYLTTTQAQYNGQVWDILTGGSSGPGKHDSQLSGFTVMPYKNNLGIDIVSVGMGTANSVARKVGLAREIKSGSRAWAVEVIRFNAVGLKGSLDHFVTPTIHTGETTEQGPKPILSEIDRMLSEINTYGALSTVMFTTYNEAVWTARLANQLLSYTVTKS